MSTTVFSDIDWERDGKQVGTIYLPHSPDDDAWGVIPFPAASIKNGQGPVVVVSPNTEFVKKAKRFQRKLKEAILTYRIEGALTKDQMKDEVLKLRKEQLNLRFQRASGQLEKTDRISKIRKDIARLKTAQSAAK